MKNSLLLIFALLMIVGCSKDEPEANGKVWIRIQNVSEFDFTSVSVNTGGGENNYGDLDAHRFSVYKAFESAYRYAYVQVKIDGETFTIQPIDYVGETLLDPGYYTYKVNAVETGDQFTRLSLTLD